MIEYCSNPAVRSKVYREPLRVGTVARICRVSNKTIVNWINQGALKSFATHGGHNRIWPVDLHTFLDRTGIDVEFKFEDKRETRFLIVNEKPGQRKLLLDSFRDRFPFASAIATQSEYEALLLMGEYKPHVVTWDLDMPRPDGARIIEFLKKRNINTFIHVTHCRHIGEEELKWHAYAGITREEKMGTGLTAMLNSLQTLLTPSAPLSSRMIARQAQQPFPCLLESSRSLGNSN